MDFDEFPEHQVTGEPDNAGFAFGFTILLILGVLILLIRQ